MMEDDESLIPFDILQHIQPPKYDFDDDYLSVVKKLCNEIRKVETLEEKEKLFDEFVRNFTVIPIIWEYVLARLVKIQVADDATKLSFCERYPQQYLGFSTAELDFPVSRKMAIPITSNISNNQSLIFIVTMQ